jgi:hypothetical protein
MTGEGMEEGFDEEEAGELVRCADCGTELVPALERGFVTGADTVLCYDCAERRGGSWDEQRGVWSGEPDLIGLRRTDPAER